MDSQSLLSSLLGAREPLLMDRMKRNASLKVRAKREGAPDINRKIGRRLRELRIAQGITMPMLAEMIGVTFQQVQKYESGFNGLKPEKLLAFSRALKVPVASFFEASAPPEESAVGMDRRLIRLVGLLRRIEDRRPGAINAVCGMLETLDPDA